MNRKALLTNALLLPLVLLSQTVFADTMSAPEILQRVDKNYVSDAHANKVRLIIRGARGTRELVTQSWIEGDNAFTEYLAPARERGTKMLKKDDRLWAYTPASDRIIAIAGHLLRKSMAGSDLSYEDFMVDPILSRSYQPKLVGEEKQGKWDTYMLDLDAKPGVDVAYDRRKIWVDKESFIPVRQELFAKSGKKLKTIRVDEIATTGERYYAKKVFIKDQLKSGKGTEVVIEDTRFNIDIPRSRFSKGALWK